jgi:hypothetical protein
MSKHLIAAVLLVCQSLTVQASRLVQLDVEQHAAVYHIHVEMVVDAPPQRVRAILTDYDNLGRLNPSITASRVIAARDDGARRVLTRFAHCVLVFCVDLQKVEDISEDEQGRLRMAVVPDASSFRSGLALLDIQPAGSGSRVTLHAQLEPETRLPAWLGAGIVRRALRREVRVCFENLATLARGSTPARQTRAGENAPRNNRRADNQALTDAQLAQAQPF